MPDDDKGHDSEFSGATGGAGTGGAGNASGGPRMDAGGLSTAMRRADQQQDNEDAIESALAKPAHQRTLTVHSTSFRAMLAAQEIALKEHAAEIKDRIDALNAEYDDVMLTHSMISAAITAQDKANATGASKRR